MVIESPLVKNCRIAQTFPGHEMMTVVLFKNQLRNFGFRTYIWLQRRKVRAGVEVLHQKSRPIFGSGAQLPVPFPAPGAHCHLYPNLDTL